MVPTLNLSTLRNACPPSEDNRKKSLDAVQKFKDAQKELERVCEEQGIPVPVMVCAAKPHLTAAARDAIMTRIVTKGGLDEEQANAHYRACSRTSISMREYEQRVDAYLQQWAEQNPA